MIEALHALLHSTRLIWLFLSLIGIAYALSLYLRAFQSWMEISRSQSSQRRQRTRISARAGRKRRQQPSTERIQDEQEDPEDSPSVDSEAPLIQSPPAVDIVHAADDGADNEGTDSDVFPAYDEQSSAVVDDAQGRQEQSAFRQQNILESLPDDEVATPAVPESSIAGKESEETRLYRPASNTYSVDQNARTRHDLVSPEEARQYGVNEQATTMFDRPAVDSPIDRSRAPTEPIYAEQSGERPKHIPSDEELLRRATRMEELGFHVGILSQQLAKNPAQVSEREKQELLKTLGLLEQQAEEQSLVTEPDCNEDAGQEKVDLDDILSRLDQALGEEFPAVASSPAMDGEPASASPDPDPDPEPEKTRLSDDAQQEVEAASSPAEEDAEPVQDDATTGSEPEPEPEQASQQSVIEAPPPAQRRRPRSDQQVPAWARADTFDEDADGVEGQQLDIFQQPEGEKPDSE